VTRTGSTIPTWAFGLALAAFGPNLMLAVLVGWAVNHAQDGIGNLAAPAGLAGLCCILLALSAVAWRRRLKGLAIVAAILQLAPLASFIPLMISSALR
jgi:hypothetical protein